MKLELCTDMNYVADVMCDPEMWERISEDSQYIEDFALDAIKENWIFLTIQTDDGPGGVFALHPTNSTTWKIHAHVLEPYRKHSKEAGKAMMEWMAVNLPLNIEKIITEVPEIFQDVYYFVKHHGFQDEGINRKSIKMHGKLVDQHYLGITREEIYSWVGSNP